MLVVPGMRPDWYSWGSRTSIHCSGPLIPAWIAWASDGSTSSMVTAVLPPGLAQQAAAMPVDFGNSGDACKFMTRLASTARELPAPGLESRLAAYAAPSTKRRHGLRSRSQSIVLKSRSL